MRIYLVQAGSMELVGAGLAGPVGEGPVADGDDPVRREAESGVRWVKGKGVDGGTNE